MIPQLNLHTTAILGQNYWLLYRAGRFGEIWKAEIWSFSQLKFLTEEFAIGDWQIEGPKALIKVFDGRATGFNRQEKLFELSNLFIRNLLDGQTRRAKSFSCTAIEFVQCPVLYETPEDHLENFIISHWIIKYGWGSNIHGG